MTRPGAASGRRSASFTLSGWRHSSFGTIRCRSSNLNNFAVNGRIGVVELPGDKRSERSTKDTTVVRDFYLLDEVPEERDAFEKALGGIESSIAPVVRSVLDRKVWPLPPEERDNLARFATLQFLRGPNHREHINQMTAMMVRAELAGRGLEHEYLEHIAGLTAEIDPEDVEADSPVSLDKFQVQVPPIAHIDQIG
ncbi:DUF4238 domain-containing protein, partial [Rhodococcus opacus]|uniref:DUF4238 domain-containing protein n=1 Tax=Rhodococcus opacus TaxID=37919 RepID=UPI001009D7BF